MYDIPLVTSSNTLSSIQYWKSILLYHDRPHIVNRKLAGISIGYIYKIDSIKHIRDLFSITGILYEIKKLNNLEKENLNDIFLKNFIEPYDKNIKLKQITVQELHNAQDGVFISTRILLPRSNLNNKCVEIVILNKNKNEVTFFAANENDKINLTPKFPYVIELTTIGHIRICVNSIDDAETNNAEWLTCNLFEKIMKWCEDLDLPKENEIIHSLSLIAVDKYVILYHELKEKYAKKVTELWCERTDPQKYVFEDIAIAAYLICLWQNKNKGTSKPSFVDLGCGNGLLVYILTSEGYSGFGVDVRSRKIWELYPEFVKLEEKSIIPSSTSLFPQSDWIIGNHSDELTPWIPVIALRSSQKTNFFLLPCCAYDFDGKKYKRLNSSQSQYTEYLQYVKQMCITCGFKTEIDKLRIPSTKRTCLVGYYNSDNNYEEVNKNITSFIQSRVSGLNENSEWVEKFTPRATTEPVRNCTQLNKTLINNIIKKCMQLVLDKQNNPITKYDGLKWNQGGKIEFSILPNHIDSSELKQLKNECGGLQTLLKNHRYIFEVKNGSFCLQKPLNIIESNGKYRDKPCWFQNNHPDGCLNNYKLCAYKHN